MGDCFRIHLRRWAPVFVFALIFRNMNKFLRQFQKIVVVYLKDKALALGDYIFDGNAIVLESKMLFLDTVLFKISQEALFRYFANPPNMVDTNFIL